MTERKDGTFELAAFLAKAGLGRRIVQLKANETFFTQGSVADSIFYLQKGRAKLTVLAAGKEATVALLAAEDFVGEESLAGRVGLRSGNCHRHHSMYRAQDREGGDGPGDA